MIFSALPSIRRLLGISLLCQTLAAASASLCSAEEAYFGREHPRNTFGFDLDFAPFARFGASNDTQAAQGDFLVQVTPHYWYNHLLEFHAVAGYGISHSTFVVGGGLKINLLEVFGTPGQRTLLKDISGFGDSGLHQRGVLGSLLGDFMVYASGSAVHYSLSQPNLAAGQTYNPSAWSIEPAAGVQIYFKGPAWFARREYLDFSMTYVPLNGTNYVAPAVGFGFELK